MDSPVEETVTRAARGDRQAVAELYDRFAPLVRASCLDRRGDPQLAWDVCQEVFATVLTDLDRLEAPGRFLPWILGIARNKLADTSRREHRFDRHKDGVARTRIVQEAYVANRDRLDGLREAIHELPERQRLAIQLFHVEGQPAARIAPLLDISLRSVYAALAAGRDTLKRNFTDRETVYDAE